MSALITHTLDEDLRILLIAQPSKFSRLLIKKIQQQVEIEIKLVSPLEFEVNKFNEKHWYKVILLLEDSLDRYPPIAKQLCFLPAKTTVIMPMTTAIEVGKDEASLWVRQLKLEQDLFNSLVKNIDESRFLFYSDLVSGNSELLKLFFNQVERGLLIDPNIELGLQNLNELTSILSINLLKPRDRATLISGKKRISGNSLQEIKRLYLSQYQINLPIKRVQLKLVSHPINIFLNQLKQESTSEKLPHLCREVMSLMIGVGRKKVMSSDRKDQLSPPTKKKLNRPREEAEFSNRKIRLDLEHDLDHEVAESEVVVEELELKTEVDEENSNERQPGLINSLFKDYRTQQKQKHLQKLTKKTRVGFRKLKGQRFLFGGGILVSLTALSALVAVGIFFTSLSQAQGSLLSYLESRTMPVTAQQKKLAVMGETVDNLEGKLALINKWFSTPFFSQSFQLIEVSRLIVSLHDQVAGFEKATSDFFHQVMTQEGEGSVELVNRDSIEVFKTLSLLSAELKNYSLDKLSPEQSQLIVDYQKIIEGQEKRINQFQQLSPLLPDLLAQDDTKTYALVLQNNQELRPTGGFIQAVALLTFKDSSLINFQVEDVYTLDQQLKATISPPDEIKQFLGEERWFLRDSNWHPSFPDTAKQIKWFLEKSIAVKVDGVIGINLKVLEEIVAVLDRVEIDEYNEVLTKRNLDERMEFHSEVQLVETVNKRDYAELVLFKVLGKIQYLPAEQVTPLLSSLVNMADSKELLVSVFDNDLETTFESLGWNGSIVKPACPTVFDDNECLVDSLMQVEANVGVNKANYYLERQIDHSIAITSKQVSHKRVIAFKNKAQTNAWPKGSYKSYIRFYLPDQAEFEDIKINGQSVALDKLTIKEELGRNVVGVLIEVVVKSELKLQLEYSLTHEYQTPFTYSFFDQKQPGARDVSPRIFVTHEPDLSPVLIAPQAEVQGEVIVFNPSKDSGHMFVGASFE
jgi:hypothetical protein